MSTIAGSGGITLYRVDRRWSSGQGWLTTLTYNGNAAVLFAATISPRYVRGAVEIELREQGASSVLRISFANRAGSGSSGEQLLSSVWSLPDTEEQVDIFSHPNAQTLETAHSGWLRMIEDEVEKYTEGDMTSDFALSNDAKKGNPTENTLAEELADALLKGVTHYIVERYQLINSRIVPADTSLRLVHTDVGKFFTLPNLRIHIYKTLGEGIPSSLIGALPTGGFWRKRRPGATQQANGTWQLKHSWEHVDHFEDFVYDEQTNP
jgi:hypothetical protein